MHPTTTSTSSTSSTITGADGQQIEAYVDGGSPEHRERLVAQYIRFLEANNLIDWDMLREVWSSRPGNIYFNLGGWTYYGLEDWITARAWSATKAWVGTGSSPSGNPNNYRSTRILERENGQWMVVVHAHFSIHKDPAPRAGAPGSRRRRSRG